MSSDVPKLNRIPPDPRPSGPLADASKIYYVDTTTGVITYRWKSNPNLSGGGSWIKI